ncbi:hypothetical protein ANN_22390 [Periplaneta americana]|uniref:Uncharacterized protein n=1 Tax=Periplaneta americana TaxID=6978 RepID=A0ABQ8S867_PERAM|nr:hypothetical protein ANN_22390 [Periplaneta americana]
MTRRDSKEKCNENSERERQGYTFVDGMPEFYPAGVLLHVSKSTDMSLSHLCTLKCHRPGPGSNPQSRAQKPSTVPTTPYAPVVLDLYVLQLRFAPNHRISPYVPCSTYDSTGDLRRRALFVISDSSAVVVTPMSSTTFACRSEVALGHGFDSRLG